jgi:hypothetical protein
MQELLIRREADHRLRGLTPLDLPNMALQAFRI